jgi:hypothetical protein
LRFDLLGGTHGLGGPCYVGFYRAGTVPGFLPKNFLATESSTDNI